MTSHNRMGQLLPSVSANAQESRELGRGWEGIVELDPETMIVTKRFVSGDASESAARATREYDCLLRFSALLESKQFLNCPFPVAADPYLGTVRMTYCEGDPLDMLLAGPGEEIVNHLDHIAEQISIAVDCFVDHFSEPYFDLTTMNMLYDQASRVLSLVDFTLPRVYPGVDSDTSRHEISLGSFVGVTTYHTVRPATLGNRQFWLRQQYLSRATLRAFALKRVLMLATVRRVSDLTYQSMGGWGSARRRLWFATVGRTFYVRRRNAVLTQRTFPRDSSG